jgi:Na+-translocating ferredoxin:NAD+ oxidoreductase subunit G
MSRLAEVREKLSYQGISLGVIALLTSAALAIANNATHDEIIAAEKRDLQASLTQVLPAGIADNDLLNDTVSLDGPDGVPVTVYRARKAGTVSAAVYQMAARGYAADVVVLIGVDMNGRMLGARVIKHSETPGLGDKIEIAKTKWILAFNGKSLGDPAPDKWAVKKDGGIFDQFAGATITPRAVVKAVKSGLDFFAIHRTEIVQGKTS